MKYTTINRVLSKFYRDTRSDIDENDAIEWIGEAMDFLNVYEINEQCIDFLKVYDYQTDLPTNFLSILQVARYRDSISNFNCPSDATETSSNTIIELTDVESVVENEFGISHNTSCFNSFLWRYGDFTSSSYYLNNFTPVRLANHSFFNTLVSKELDDSPYRGSLDEYTIVGTTDRKIRTSFKEGCIALSYLRAAIGEDGYPLIPDNISCITAIVYYMKWKMSERYQWQGRQGADSMVALNNSLWTRYIRQFRNNAKLPKTIDQYQNILEETHQLLRKHQRYANFFGSLGREEYRKWNDPDYRNKIFIDDYSAEDPTQSSSSTTTDNIVRDTASDPILDLDGDTITTN